ncbi:MAG: EAL domain-containing protein [Rhizobiaceae bacterium]|nr:EAL domain-containing protein [Rhizobiaceae bacterium]
MSRSIGLAHIVRQSDGTSNGVWGVFTLKSAFQPIFAFRDGKLEITAFEGLIRPFRDGAGMSPGVFFNLVPAQDRLHVETLSRTLHLLNAGACLDKRARIFVNFDPSVFVEKTIADNALREMRLVLHEAGIDHGRIVCEITEQKTSSQSGLHMFVHALREQGFAIAVDDYGAEESGIDRINALNPDIVKFDAHFITHLMRSGPGFALLETMVAQFEGRGITTLFEGIEEPWQLELAEKCGTSMVQGFVLARPQLAPTTFGEFSPENPVHDDGDAAYLQPRKVAPTPAPMEPENAVSETPRHAPQRRVFGQRVNRQT